MNSFFYIRYQVRRPVLAEICHLLGGIKDYGTMVVGSLRDLAGFHRASPISTWAGQNLDVQVTRPQRYKDCKSNDTRSHLGIESLVQIRRW